jgi:acetoacetate decarboxylase
MLSRHKRCGFLVLAFFFFACSFPAESQEVPKAYCMPSLSPLYSSPPVQFRDNRVIVVVFKTAPEVLQELVPKPLLPNPANLMFIYIGSLNIEDPSIGKYNYLEAGIGVPAIFSKTLGNYAVCLYLNKALPIVGGREIWGWPKKDAEITFTEKEGEIRGRVERFGRTLLSLSARLGNKVDPIPSQPELPWFLLKIIPSARKNAPPDVWQLISSLNINSGIKELWNCTATIQLESGPLDALGNIKAIEIVSAQFSVGDFAMDYGEVLHDYLAADRK